MRTRIILIGLFSGLLFGIATPFSKIILSELNSFQLAGLLYLVEKEFFMMFTFRHTALLGLLGLFLISTGILINIISTYFSVNRYLAMDEDKLYY